MVDGNILVPLRVNSFLLFQIVLYIGEATYHVYGSDVIKKMQATGQLYNAKLVSAAAGDIKQCVSGGNQDCYSKSNYLHRKYGNLVQKYMYQVSIHLNA